MAHAGSGEVSFAAGDGVSGAQELIGAVVFGELTRRPGVQDAQAQAILGLRAVAQDPCGRVALDDGPDELHAAEVGQAQGGPCP